MVNNEYELRRDIDNLIASVSAKETYTLKSNASSVIFNGNEPNPSSLKFDGYKIFDDGKTETCACNLRIESSIDSVAWNFEKEMIGEDLEDNNYSISITPSDAVRYYRCHMYFGTWDENGQYMTRVDIETIPVLSSSDGTVVVDLDNEAQMIPTDENGITTNNMEITVGFNAYLGTNRKDIQYKNATGLPNGITVKSSVDGNSAHGGTIVLSVAKDSNLGGNRSGVVIFQFNVNTVSYLRGWSWAKAMQGLTGATGATGATGPKGQNGKDGKDGQDGEQGPKGEDGKDG
mgnify:FL=1